MSTEQIEEALRRLTAPDAPGDLPARCRATAPISRPATLPATRRTLSWRRVTLAALAAAGCAALALLTTVHRIQPPSATRPEGSIAFADTVAMSDSLAITQRAPCFTETETTVYPYDPPKKIGRYLWRFPGGRTHTMSYFDVQKGFYMAESNVEGFDWRALTKPNGRSYWRDGSTLGSGKSLSVRPAAKNWSWRRYADGLRQATVIGMLPLPGQQRGIFTYVGKHTGRWHGRPAILYTFTAGPSYIARLHLHLPAKRNVSYVSPRSGLILGSRSYDIAPSGVESLSSESSMSYAPLPSGVFSVARFERGANHHVSAQP